MIQVNLLSKHRDSQKGLENELMVAGGEGTVKNFGKGMYILLY